MPFSSKITLLKVDLPDLPDHSLIYYCKPTEEGFLHYEDYSSRVIQCNSLVWTDIFSGKCDLTYSEACESEIKSMAVLLSLPEVLHIPVIFLASIARCSSFEEKLNDVYHFIEDRFFLGENIQFCAPNDNVWKEGIVSKVIAPSEEEIVEMKSSVISLVGGEFFPPATHYLYEVECSDGSGNKYSLGIPSLKRPTGIWTKAIAESFLQHLTIQDEDKWLINRGVLEKFKISEVKFVDFYDGKAPVFPIAQICGDFKPTSVIKKSVKVAKKELILKCNRVLKYRKSDKMITKQRRKRFVENSAVNRKMSSSKKRENLQQTDIKNYFISSSVQEENQGSSVSAEESFDSNLLVYKSRKNDLMDDSVVLEDMPKEGETLNDAVPGTSKSFHCAVSKRRKVRSTFFKKGRQLKLTGYGQLEGMERNLKHAAKVRGAEKLRKEKKEQAVLEGIRLHEERLRRKAKKEEEKLQFAKFMKEWRKKREDLECEDMKPLPVPHQISGNIPNHLFGDFVMILEFLNSFYEFLKVKKYIPGGVSLDLLERALIEKEIAGPLHDILCIFLNSIYECQTAENDIANTSSQLSVDTLDETASSSAGIQYLDPTGLCETFLGISIQELDLTPLSISEILRLHLLGSGGRHRYIAEWSTNCDDPIIWFRKEHGPVLFRLCKLHVCELSVDEKLTILSCLMNKILAYTQVRDLLDDRGEQMRMAKAELRALEIAELKLQKEATAKRIKNKRTAKLLRLKGESSAKANSQLLQHQKDGEIEKAKIEKEITKVKSDIQRKQKKVLPLVMKHQLHPIGSDRAHRQYWLFSSLPGLFVEYSPFEVGQCLPQPTPLRTEDRGDIETHVRKLFQQGQNCNSDKENDTSDGELSKPPCSPTKKMLAEQNVSVDPTNCGQNDKDMFPKELEEKDVPQYEFLICTADNKCPVHYQPFSGSRWCFFSNPGDVVLLLDSLNERGIRESDLKRAMMREQERIKESISSCPLQKLSASKFGDQEPRKSTRNSVCYKPEVVNMNFPPGTPVEKIMESILRDTILDMENKITLGCLGVLKVEDRAAWRSALEKGDYDPQCERLVWGLPRSLSEEKCPRKVINELNGTSKTDLNMIDDLNMIEVEEDEKLAEEGGFSPYRRIKNEESPDNSYGNSDVDSYTEKPGDNLPSGELDESRFEEMGECDGQNSLFGNGLNSLSEDEMSLSSESKQRKVGEGDEKAAVEVYKRKMKSLGRKVILMEVTQRRKIIHELASAILQLGQSVDPQCLLKPLADNNGEESPLLIKYWETSVMTALNFSQLFLYQFILEKSINWSKSILRKPCRICRRRGEPETMVSCSECHKRYHLNCTNSEDPEIQKDSWVCSFCEKECVPKSSKTKKRKNNFMKPECNEVLVNNSPERKSPRLVCHKCGDSGEQLINCSLCSKVFHGSCLNPHLRGNLHQEENWLCDSCLATRDSDSSDAESEYSTSTKDPDETPERGRRDCTSSVVTKIASFANDRSETLERGRRECTSSIVAKIASCARYRDENLGRGRRVCSSPTVAKLASLAKDPEKTRGRVRRVCASATMAKIASYAKRLRSRSWDDEEEEGTSDYSSSTRSSREYVHNQECDSTIRRSSRRADYISESLPLDNAVLQNLLDEIIHHEASWPFLRPVRKSEVPDYHQFIKKPMDLGTIKYKLNTAEYKANYEFIGDTLLVFENCFMYNRSETAVYKSGVELLQYFKKRCQELGLHENLIQANLKS